MRSAADTARRAIGARTSSLRCGGPSPRSAPRYELEYDVVNQLVAPTRNDLSQVHTVPDPYYVSSKFQSTSQAKIIEFVHLPADCIIRIYSLSGVLVTTARASFGHVRRIGDLGRAEPQQPGGRERGVLLSHRGRRRSTGRTVHGSQLRRVAFQRAPGRTGRYHWEASRKEVAALPEEPRWSAS